MGFFGNFLGGAVAGIVGLGIVSWAVSTFSGEDSDDDAGEEE